jgi:hypothetical protein
MNVACVSGMLPNNVSGQGSIHYLTIMLESNYSTGQNKGWNIIVMDSGNKIKEHAAKHCGGGGSIKRGVSGS